MLLLTGCARFHFEPVSPEQTAAQFESRTLTNVQLRAFLETNQGRGSWPKEEWDLPSLTLAALYFQPDLGVARAQWESARAAEKTAGERPNPTVSVTPGYDSQIPGTPSPWIVPLTFDFPIETAGKRGHRIAQAQYLSESARWKLVGAIWQARSQIRDKLLNLYSAAATRALLNQQLQAQSNVVRLLEGQLNAGAASGFDLSQARIALNTSSLSLQDADRQYVVARNQLASAIGVPISALNGVRFSFKPFEVFPKELMKPDVRRRALLTRADVRGALAEYAASQAALQLAIAGQYPDLHLGPGYSWNTGSSGDNEWQLGLSVTLPVLNHNQGAVAEAEAKRKEAAAQFLSVQAKAIGEIDTALAAYRASILQTTTANALVKNLESRLASVREMQKAGEVDPLATATAQVEFAAGAASRLNALVTAQQALGQLEDAVQNPLSLPDEVIKNAQVTSNTTR